jgi:hypothetical protein
MRNEAGHEPQVNYAVPEDLIGNVDIAALGVADRRRDEISPPKIQFVENIAGTFKRWCPLRFPRGSEGDRSMLFAPLE